MTIAVLGAGSWGTTLSILLVNKGHEVRTWVHEPTLAGIIRSRGRNEWYLPDYELPKGFQATSDLAAALAGAEFVLCAVPSQHVRSVMTKAAPLLPKKPIIVCASKGIEMPSLAPMNQVIEEALTGLKPVFAMLSGPSFAREVVAGHPTAITLACKDKKIAAMLQEALSTDIFRVYTNTDVAGVELGGAIKNVIAIAAGLSDGLGFGANARAALITRGLAEMGRLAVAMGAKRDTFMGLSGLGDLVLTCTGDLSRNRQVGLRLAEGKKLMDILSEMRMVAEGVKTTEAVHGLGIKHKVDMPITNQMYAILYEDKEPRSAVRELMGRALRGE